VLIGTIQSTVDRGDVLVAVPLAFAAGLVSFFSPCVLPLVPGYVAFLGGTTGAGTVNVAAQVTPTAPARRHAGRAVAGALAFVVGFSFVYVSLGTVFGGIGHDLRDHTRILEICFGAATICFGAFFAGVLPSASFLNRELRVHWLPPATILGAAALGLMFGLAWVPCVGPTLAAILGLEGATPGADAWRGTLLVSVYCLGLGMPFVLAAVASQSIASVSRFARRHGRWIMVIGGVLLIAIGVLEVTGLWTNVVQWAQDHLGNYIPPI
jgi:cytochrome c-type biogenesis protein